MLILIVCILTGCGQKSATHSGHAGKNEAAKELPDEDSAGDKGYPTLCSNLDANTGVTTAGSWAGQYHALVGRGHSQSLAISQDGCRSISFTLKGMEGKRKYGWELRLMDWRDDLKWVPSDDAESQTLERIRRGEDQTLIHERCQRVGQECAFLVFSERYRMLSDGSILYEGVWPDSLQLRFLRTAIP